MKDVGRRIKRFVGKPAISYLDPRFASIDRQLDEIREQLQKNASSSVEDQILEVQGKLACRLDLVELNAVGTRPTFAHLQSQAVSESQFDEAAFARWFGPFADAGEPNAPFGRQRKLWEWVYIAEAASQAGVLSAGRTALGFGVGQEPLPAIFAHAGMNVLATDQNADAGPEWAVTGQLSTGLAGLSRPKVISDADLAVRVRTREVDMNDIPDDIGTFDLVWSSCALEHLGSPQHGLDFVANTCRLLNPGGVAVHTTELELTRKDRTVDYGNCAVYRKQDLEGLGGRLRAEGYELSFNFTIAMETPSDRWISPIGYPPAPPKEPAHLKLVIGGESISTSFGLIIRRPV